MCSRAATSPSPHFRLSQCAIDLQPHSRHDSRRSSSPISNTNRHVAAAICPASVHTSASMRSVASSTPTTTAVITTSPLNDSGDQSYEVGVTTTPKTLPRKRELSCR
jgi:hypothetical protein